MASTFTNWPDLETPGWVDTCRTLQLWSQVLGKTRLALTPMVNHWWNASLHPTAHGISTLVLMQGDRAFEVELDLTFHRLLLRSSLGIGDAFPLTPGTLVQFWARYMEGLDRIGIEVSLRPLAVEIPETVFLDRDETPRPYHRDWAQGFFQALLQADWLMEQFRSSFLGKVSPVQFFWGSFDLAVTRFSGRTAPLHPGGAPHCPDWVMQEAYSHEVSSAGFWPGNAQSPHASFYSYAYPEPPGFRDADVLPEAAHYDEGLREFILPYEAVRTSQTPERDVLSFLQSTYDAAARLGRWPRHELERSYVPAQEAEHEIRM